jgi:2-keto-4-pentenoate hydratase/2-oxohepta-3-ene-1,7-dioic acid hydratase in catechol pathway
MRLIRFGPVGKEKPGILSADGQRRDVSAHFKDWDFAFLNESGLRRLAKFIVSQPVETLPKVDEKERWGAPIARPGKVICIGLNYSDHARESGMAIPNEPIVFMKAANTVVGPYDELLIPRTSKKTDWEVELGVVIGKTARYLESLQQAEVCVAGYTVSHDVSEREFQLERGGQWTKGKSCDTFNPLGPWLSTTDEIKNSSALPMTLSVNGEVRQNGNTSTMVFGVAELIRYLSQFMTLEPGDVISTGTPPGVGMAMKPQQFLKAGDVVELEIAGLGKQRQVCGQA